MCILQVTDLSDVPATSRELMLVKVRCNASQRGELRDLAQIFHGNICDVSLTTVTLELQGKEDKMQALQKLLKPYGTSCYIQDCSFSEYRMIAEALEGSREL